MFDQAIGLRGNLMDPRLAELAESQYRQPAFLTQLFELAVEEQWSVLQHMIQHDMAKAILANYCIEKGQDYLKSKAFFESWEEIIQIGWKVFCEHTGLSMEKVQENLHRLHEI